jgi:hypothetical protein
MAEIRFVADLGAEVRVPLPGNSAREVRQALFRTLREYGQLGWRAIPIPPGGLRFPLANEPDFDWRLLGARRGRGTVEGEERDGVWYDGQFYSRRQFEANPRRKLGPAVKYSRVAKNGDSPEAVEEADGGFGYVTLAVFRGEGRRREAFAIAHAEGEAENISIPQSPRPAAAR